MKGMRLWDPSNEAFGMTGPGGLKGPPALLHALGSIVMHVVRGEHRDPAMAMFGVVPREERSAEGDRGGDVVEAAREAGVVLQGLELRLDTEGGSVNGSRRGRRAVVRCTCSSSVNDFETVTIAIY